MMRPSKSDTGDVVQCREEKLPCSKLEEKRERDSEREMTVVTTPVEAE